MFKLFNDDKSDVEADAGMSPASVQPSEPVQRTYPSCSTCVFCDYRNPTQPMCRKSPPQLIVVNDNNGDGLRKFWPVVDLNLDWCGEHRVEVQEEPKE